MKLTTLFTLALTVVQVTALDQNEKDSWIDQILHDIEQAVTCGGCEVGALFSCSQMDTPN